MKNYNVEIRYRAALINIDTADVVEVLEGWHLWSVKASNKDGAKTLGAAITGGVLTEEALDRGLFLSMDQATVTRVYT